jgi:dihydrofolate reductase
MKAICLILACTKDGGIGYNNKIPWYYKEDLYKFREITTTTKDKNKENSVIMGSKTYESLPVKILKNRENIIISRNKSYGDLKVFNDIEKSLEYCDNNDKIETIFIIGGSEIYNYFIENNKLVDKIYLTIINNNYNCDKFININEIYNKFNLEDCNKYISENYKSFICYNKI